jgi:hypothetical protein
MLVFGERQRAVWIDTLSQAANVAAGGMLFGQFVSERPFSWSLACAGIGAWIVLLLWSTFLARNRVK